MFEIKGKYAKAKIFTDLLEEEAISQITQLLNLKIADGGIFRIMPDAHAGKGCVVGFVGKFKEDIAIPNLIGVDIGCGMTTLIFNEEVSANFEDLDNLDKVIRKNIPCGQNVRKDTKIFNVKLPKHALKELEIDIVSVCKDLNIENKVEYFKQSIGTLGGGNHFIELGKVGNSYTLIIHSGSRNFGHQIATYHQNVAIKHCNKRREELKEKIHNINVGKDNSDLYETLAEYERYLVPDSLAFLEGADYQLYLQHMRIAKQYAMINRKTIGYFIFSNLNITYDDLKYGFETFHNYIDCDNVIRKGAIRTKNEDVVIPLNMRDGTILGVGKNEEDWLYSGPHGAGRLMSRSKAKDSLNLEDLKKDMKDVYTTSINQSTLDESPRAYKNMEDIIKNIGDTVDIVEIIKPIYNFKG